MLTPQSSAKQAMKCIESLKKNNLLEKGSEYGCTWYALNTPKFAFAAQHIYKSVGFEFVDFIPEVDIGEPLRPYYLFMEKKE